jgi:hypothetical protein
MISSLIPRHPFSPIPIVTLFSKYSFLILHPLSEKLNRTRGYPLYVTRFIDIRLYLRYP